MESAAPPPAKSKPEDHSETLKLEEVTMEELFPAEVPQASAPEEEEASPEPVVSSVDLWFSPVEAAPPAPVAETAAPVARTQAPAPKPQASPPQQAPVAAATATPPPMPAAPAPVIAAPVAVKPSPAGAAPAAIVKASIFSVIEDDEEDETDGGTNWAEKYIQPKAQAQAPPQIERRDPVRPEPAHSAGNALPKGTSAVQKQPSLNLHQDNVARFKGTDKTIVEGEDLDVPTWMRLRGKVAK
jgi:hypothetical protein